MINGAPSETSPQKGATSQRPKAVRTMPQAEAAATLVHLETLPITPKPP